MTEGSLLAFAVVAGVLTVTPGADTMLVIRNVLARGRLSGVATTLGICAGVLVHALVSAAGISVLLVRSATAFEIVKLAGAGYLVLLGGLTIFRVAPISGSLDQRSDPSRPPRELAPALVRSPYRASFIEGLLTNVLNPKVAVFYLAFLPQFVTPGDPVLLKSVLLATIHLLMGVMWLVAVSLSVARLASFLTGARVRRALDRLAGAVLIALGVRLALERR